MKKGIILISLKSISKVLGKLSVLSTGVFQLHIYTFLASNKRETMAKFSFKLWFSSIWKKKSKNSLGYKLNIMFATFKYEGFYIMENTENS